MTLRPGIDAERALDRAQSDPAYEAALRDAYRGRHDVLDALWWAAHPLSDTARGQADPAVELRELQRAAYARASDPAQAGENMRRLQEAEHLLAEDAQSLAGAVDAADQSSAPQPGEPQGAEFDAAPRPRRRLLLPVLSGVALLVAIMVLPSLMQLDAGADPEPTSSARPADRVHTDIITMGAEGNLTDPLAILERAQTPQDQPAGELRFEAETYRALTSLVPHVELYLARGDPDEICLIVVGADEQVMGSCQPTSEFTNGELRLSRGRYELSSDTTILTESYSLFPNGDFRYAATARVTGDLAFPSTGAKVSPDLD